MKLGPPARREVAASLALLFLGLLLSVGAFLLNQRNQPIGAILFAAALALASFAGGGLIGREARRLGRHVRKKPETPAATRSTAEHYHYIETVKTFAPPALLDRDLELNRLAAFCTVTEGPAYLWVQAGPWTGKSALMAWFVLHPPTGVRVVSFFVTARMQYNNDRAAFIENTALQLASLIEGSAPRLTPSTRETEWTSLVTAAAQWCHDRNERLVLIVDGLDEDQGASGVDGYSIAALLPPVAPDGMRVIVAGRPNPPLPADLAKDHPLHDPGIAWQLPRSPHAEAIQEDAEREVARLLDGNDAERDVLGFIAMTGTAATAPSAVGAAGAVGLTDDDLSELVGIKSREVRKILTTAKGRTFLDAPGIGVDQPQVWTLGHDQLQRLATHELADRELTSGYLSRLGAWAERYQNAAWPPSTPAYLLRGHFGLLASHHETAQLVAYAADIARHERLLGTTGADAIALGEIQQAQQCVADEFDPDLVAQARLAVHRAHLIVRNVSTPAAVAIAWASVGDIDRAENVAKSVADPGLRLRALAGIAWVTARAGDHGYARRLIAEAEAIAGHSSNSFASQRERASLAWSAAAVGDFAHALTIAGNIADASVRAQALGGVAYASARAGNFDEARSIVGSITEPYEQARALAAIAAVAATDRYLDRASRLLAEAQTIIEAIADPAERVHPLAGLAWSTAVAGDFAHAQVIAGNITDASVRAYALGGIAYASAEAGNFDEARTIIESVSEPYEQVRALAAVAEIAETNRDLDRAGGLLAEAHTISRSITDPYRRVEAVAGIAEAAVTGNPDLAHQLVMEALSLAGFEPDSYPAANVLAGIAKAAAATGDLDQVLLTVETIADPYTRAGALAAIAQSVATTHDLDLARRMVSEAQAVAGSINNPEYQAEARASLAYAVAIVGDIDLAQAVAMPIAHLNVKARALGRLAEAAAGAGQLELAHRLVAQALSLAEPVADSYDRAEALIGIARAAASTGDLDQAAAIAASVSDWDFKARALAGVAQAAAATGNLEFAKAVLAEAQRLARSTSSYHQVNALAVTQAAASTGDLDHAETLAASITDPEVKAQAFASIAQAAASAGNLDDANLAIAEAQKLAAADINLSAEAPSRIAEAMAAAGDVIGARRQLARALMAGVWPECVDALARIDPGVIESIRTEIALLEMIDPAS